MIGNVARQDVEMVEIYVPRRLEYLSELYQWLREQLEDGSLLKGFSLYEVSGAYVGTRIFTEQTMVVRLIFDLVEAELERISHEQRIDDIADAILGITGTEEEEVWLIRTRAVKTVCTPPPSQN